MRAKRTKTNAFDWAAIRWARLREENERVDEPALDPKKNERGRIVDPIVFLSERAEKILSDSGFSAARLRERVLAVWFFSLIFVAALGAIVFPFSRADRLLGGGVNLAGPFVFFLLGQIFFLATSALFVGIALVQSFFRIFRKRDAPRTFAEKTVERLCGLTGWFALIGLRQGIRGFYLLFGSGDSKRARRRFFGKKLKDDAGSVSSSETERSQTVPSVAVDERNPMKIPNERKIAFLFWDSLFSKPRFLFFWGGVLSHLFWASCSICVLLILAARMQGNRYDYRWHTSLEDERVVKKCVDFLGVPIAKLGGTVPSEEDVRRLFVSDRSLQAAFADQIHSSKSSSAPIVVVLEKDKTSGELGVSSTLNAKKTEAQTRSRWSRFLLSVVFIWCVAPRCFLAGAYYFLLRRSLRDFRPDLSDPYFKRLIDRAEAYSTTTQTATVVDSLGDENGDEICDAPKSGKIEKNPSDENVFPPSNVAQRQTSPKNVEESARFEKESSPPVPTEGSVPASKFLIFQEKRDETKKNADNNDEETDIASKIAPFAATDDVAQAEDAARIQESASFARKTKNVETTTFAQETQTNENTTFAQETATPNPPKIALALGYDAEFSSERWNDLFDSKRPPIVFPDVAADFETKKRFRTWASSNGTAVDVCAIATDVSLSPARHCVKFLRQDLGGVLGNARVFVVLSGGEKLRRKFGTTSPTAVAERIEDWRGVLAELSRTTDISFAPIFFFDAELDLPEQRDRLRRLLTNAARGEIVDVETDGFETFAPNYFTKWNAATERIDAECRRIFNENNGEKTSDDERDERDRRQIALLLAEIFAVYREETNAVAKSTAIFASTNDGETTFLQRFSKLGETSGSLGVSLVGTLAEKGLDASTFEKNLARAIGLSEKMRTFCGKLSPKCALAAGALGVSAPVVAAFAPLFGGALTATTIASTFGAFGMLLPSAFASGATGAALGAVAPVSLSACKKQLVEKWREFRSYVSTNASPTTENSEKDSFNNAPTQNNEETQDVELLTSEKAPTFATETLESVAATVCAATTWAVALELQGWSEEKIVAALPVATRPLEESPLDSPKETRRALDKIQAEIRTLREIERTRG